MSRPTGLLRIRQVLDRIPVSRAYFYELISADERLRPIKFGSLSFWTAEQIDGLSGASAMAPPSGASRRQQTLPRAFRGYSRAQLKLRQAQKQQERSPPRSSTTSAETLMH